MKILHVSAVKNWGGGENHIDALCTEIRKANPEVQNLILCVRNGEFHKKLQEKDLAYVTAPLAIKMDLRFVFKIISICRREKIDLVHMHDPTALTLTIMAAKFGDLPPLVFSKKTSFPIKDRKQTLYKYNYPGIKKILCVSEETRRVSAERITEPKKLVTIYHGVNLNNQKKEAPYRLREKLNIPEDKLLIGNIGNHIRAKHLETLLEVVNDIVHVNGRKDFFFVQMGVFTDRTEALQQRAAELDLQDHLKFMGFVPGASNFIPQFDITLVTSQSEGLPGVIYESFYHGTPVVSTNVGGIPEIIEHGENGLLADMHDHQSLSNLLLYLHDKPKLISKFTEISRKKLYEQFTSEVMAKRTLEEYKAILYGRL